MTHTIPVQNFEDFLSPEALDYYNQKIEISSKNARYLNLTVSIDPTEISSKQAQIEHGVRIIAEAFNTLVEKEAIDNEVYVKCCLMPLARTSLTERIIVFMVVLSNMSIENLNNLVGKKLFSEEGCLPPITLYREDFEKQESNGKMQG